MSLNLLQKRASHLQVVPMQLTTLAPVFIGSGVKIDQSQYYTEGGKFYYIANENAFTALLAKMGGDEFQNYRNLLIEIHSAKQRNASQHSQPTLKNFRDDSPQIKEALAQNNTIFKKYDISPFIQTVTGDVSLFHHNAFGYYIPGSSIKGAIRQLLLIDMILQDKRAESLIKSHDCDQGDQVERALLQNPWKEENSRNGDALTDFLRVLRVSDSMLIPDTSFELIKIASIRLQPEFHPPKMHRGNPPIYLVALKANEKVQFTITIDQGLMSQFKEKNADVPFHDIETLLERISGAALDLDSQIAKRIEKANKLNVYNGRDLDPNFYLGSNTGFDRHSLLGIFDIEDKTANDKKKHILEKQFRNVHRQHDNFTPRCLNASPFGKNNFTTLGWCHLEALET